MRLFIFITIFLIVFSSLCLYIQKRFFNKIEINSKKRAYLKYFLFINFLGIVGYIYSRYNPEIPNEIYFLLSLPIGILFILFLTALLFDVSNQVLKKLPIQNSRRRFFKKSLDISSLSLATIIGAKSIYEATKLEVIKKEIKIKNLKSSYKIVQISDIHIGGLIGVEFISKLVTKVNSLNPDVIAITGDLVDTKLEYAKESLKILKNLKSKYGTYFIVGNHEYLHDIDMILEQIKELDIKILENSNVYIGKKASGFNLCGVNDVMGRRVGYKEPDLAKALSQTDTSSPTILLAHQPRFIHEVEDKVDLVLSGHTHGGQIYPFGYLVKLQQPYLKGLHQHNKNTQIYVNQGTGFWGPPMRLSSTAEISELIVSGS